MAPSQRKGGSVKPAATSISPTAKLTSPSPSPSPSPSQQPSKPQRRSRWAFFKDLLLVRLINAFWLGTFFQPDEYFQALEPAWQLAFGEHSGAWLTWEWRHQLRSSLHPAVFSVAYTIADRVSRFLPFSSPSFRAHIVISAPRALQAVFAAMNDWFTWQLAVKIYGPGSNASIFTLFLQIFSPWQWYCSARTFSNSLEATLTIMALYYFPWTLLADPKKRDGANTTASLIPSIWKLRASLTLAALAVVLRPTNILIWATIAFMVLTRWNLLGASSTSSLLPFKTTFVLTREAVLCGSLVLAASLVSDYLYFGFWTFPPYKWLNFNVSQSLAVFYGRNPWHYYLLQGIPLLCTTSLPFALGAMYKPFSVSPDQANTLRVLLYTVFVTVGALSLISHKEVRFIYPLLPILSILSAPLAASFFTTASDPSKSTTSKQARRPSIRRKPLLFLGLGINVFLAGYLGFLHQAAPLTVLSYLRQEYERIHPAAALRPLTNTTSPHTEDNQELFALFLMPCHSTPWRSHLVYPNLHAYALSCEPPLHTKPGTPERDFYRDEADRFYDDPVDFLRGELFGLTTADGQSGTITLMPRYIVGFEGIEPWLRQFLQTKEGSKLGMKPQKVWEGFNGFFNEDWRRAGKMVVWDTGLYENAPAAIE